MHKVKGGKHQKIQGEDCEKKEIAKRQNEKPLQRLLTTK
jgi:hypothetical protein